MGNPAKQVTDGCGMRPVCGELFYSDLRAQSLAQDRVEIWDAEIDLFSETLGKLVGYDKFNLLASRLMNVNGYSPDTEVLAGRIPGTVAITIVGGKQYRAHGTNIHEKKKL